MSANPNLLADGSLASDQGAGLVDAAAASALLAAGGVPDALPPEKDPNPNVKVNLESGSSIKVRNGPVQETFTALKPAQRHEIFYRVAPNTKQVSVVLSDVTPSLPPAQQNQLFGDNVLLTIHSALTSNNGKAAYSTFESTSGGTFTVNDPQVGIMRVTMSGRWTNAGTISGQVTIASSVEAVPRFTQQGKIIQGESVTIPLNVPVGVSALEFRLGWSPDWASLPTDDLDLVLTSPTGAVNRRGSTMRNPEMVTIKNPVAGEWRATIIGFEVYSDGNKYEFRATADGVLLK
jgi:hypothetical protein